MSHVSNVSHAQRAKEWILSAEGSALLVHAGRQFCVTEEIDANGKVQYVQCALENMTLLECIEECQRFREIYTHLTTEKEQWQHLSDDNLYDASIYQLRSWLKYFYHPDTHSYLLRWIGAIFADTIEPGMHLP